MAIDSEFRLYGYILDRLKEVGWDTKSPMRGGQVYTQGECLKDDKLKQAFGMKRPENVVIIGEGEYWAIEAKREDKDIKVAIQEAKDRADKINSVSNASCQIITGVAGSPDTTHYVETYCLVEGKWNQLLINNRKSTGFISPDKIRTLLLSRNGKLDEYEVSDKLFFEKISHINDILHNGGINKRNRASVLACILLALANDVSIHLSSDPTTLIKDINARAESELRKYAKQNFVQEICINLPTSTDNHIKIRDALRKTIEKLRDLNIASAINSGRDVLGQCYEQFLKYANDAKEIGIVLTPRHITNFAAEVTDVQSRDKVFDPTCGTGGFLVAALDKVRKDSGDIEKFKRGCLHGVEQDALIATLAIVNMVFRGDGSSNIVEGDCLKKPFDVKVDKVLTNPPFALEKYEEYEWQFIDKALESMNEGGILFAVLPTTTMNAMDDRRGELTWRRSMLNRHTLISVIKLSNNLFYPQVSKGTYGVIIKAHHPHNLQSDKVLWAILHDGIVSTKTKATKYNNMDYITKALKNYISAKTEPDHKHKEIDCSLILEDDFLDLSPEKYIGGDNKIGNFDTGIIKRNIADAKALFDYSKSKLETIEKCGEFKLEYFFNIIERGKSGRAKNLEKGNFPLISTSERNNGISELINRSCAKKVYPKFGITISANGGSCYAHHHDYDFAANSDVYVCLPKVDFKENKLLIFLCASINNESWRFDYYRKLSKEHLYNLVIKMPILADGNIDFKKIDSIV